MRCPDCNKFVSLETETEEPTLELNGSIVSGECHVSRNCADCGTELKAADFILEMDVREDMPDCFKEDGQPQEGHDVDVKSSEVDSIEEGGGRYAKSYYGVSVAFTLECSCGKEFGSSIVEKLAASEFEEMA